MLHNDMTKEKQRIRDFRDFKSEEDILSFFWDFKLFSPCLSNECQIFSYKTKLRHRETE
jgi:hypothetical protein